MDTTKIRWWLWAVAGGLMLAAAFPKVGIAGFAWVAPGLILLGAGMRTGLGRYGFGYVSGLAHYGTTLYWLLLIPFPVGALVGWLALSAYLAVYMGFWVWLCWRLLERMLPEGERSEGGLRGIPRLGELSLGQRQAWGLGCAMVWVALEMVQGRMFSGFPWNYLGASQYRMLPLIQISSVTGVYGVSFLAVWFSVMLGCTMVMMTGGLGARRIWLGDMMLPMVVVGLVAWDGINRVRERSGSGRELSVALVQPSIPQTLIWDPTENTNRFRQLIVLSERALAEKPELLIWPEAAVPNLLRYDPWTYEAITNLVQRHAVWMILGADDAVPREEGERTGGAGQFDFYNSSFLVSPSGKLEAAYRKRRLVAFGEYVPFGKWLPFLKKLIPAGEGFTAGDRPIEFKMAPLETTTSVLICFEDVFPHLVREYVTDETDFLLNLTNNGWFGESAAQWQHGASAVFRAIENGVPLVRCSNNGLTCWVDSRGRMHEVYLPGTRDAYGPGYKTVRIPLQPADGKRAPTIYWKYGDWFGWSCVAGTGLMVAGILAGQRRKETADEN